MNTAPTGDVGGAQPSAPPMTPMQQPYPPPYSDTGYRRASWAPPRPEPQAEPPPIPAIATHTPGIEVWSVIVSVSLL